MKATIGGIIEGKTVKYTKTNKTMAFFQLEDLLGTVEVLVFPRDYERYHHLINEDAKVFVQGRVSAEDDKPSKLICERILPFGEIPRDVWIQFETKEEFAKQEQRLYQMIAGSDGNDQLVIYVRNPKAVKRLGARYSVDASGELLGMLREAFGRENVKIAERRTQGGH